MTADDGVWLYGITADSIDDSQLAGITGVAGEPVRTVVEAGLGAVVGTVSLSEFGQEPLQRHLEDLDWLTVVARAHDASSLPYSAAGPPCHCGWRPSTSTTTAFVYSSTHDTRSSMQRCAG